MIEPGGVWTNFGETAAKYLTRFRGDPKSAYRDYLKSSGGVRAAAGLESFGSSPDIVARVIYRAIAARFPRARYQATWDASLAWPLMPFIPDALRDWALARLFGLHRRAN
ncbi:MAG: hypothetical protein HY257_03700 [Chloroflexi bacterium]|nr:hypothetical protein [Chloroflexota bacterium]